MTAISLHPDHTVILACNSLLLHVEAAFVVLGPSQEMTERDFGLSTGGTNTIPF